MRTWGIILLIIVLAACTEPTQVETPTAVATTAATATPTETALPPTETATTAPTTEPTPTAEPTNTSEPTAIPTNTPEPINTFTTTDEIAFNLNAETPVIEREQGNKYLNGGAVIFHDGQFHLFSNYFNSWPGRTTTYYFTSPDGEAWTRALDEPLFTIDDVPLLGDGALMLDGLVLADGTWVLYYHTFSSVGRTNLIGRATADNPTGPWTFDETPTLAPGGAGEWDDRHVMRVNVLPHETEGYVMYYAGVASSGKSQIGLAFSADSRTFTKYDDPSTTAAPYAESDPIMLSGQVEWESSKLGRPEVVRTADGWVMLYEGGGGNHTGLAISQDGIHFDRYAANPILTRDEMPQGYTFFQGAFFHQDDTYYYLIEAGNGHIGTDIFLFTHEGSLLEAGGGESAETLTFDFTLQRGRDNPALDDGSGSDFDSAWTFAPGVIHHDDQFHMFYTGWNSAANIRIGYAVSDNGLDFERVTDDFVLELAPDDPTIGVWTPVPLVLEDGTWVLFVGKSQNSGLTNELLRATAPAPTGPWTWDAEPIYTANPTGWDGKLLPESLARTPEGGYIMSYESNWCTDTQAGVLLSDDGVNWQPYNDPDTTGDGLSSSDPVFSPTGSGDDWDRQAVSSPLIFATDTGYELFYIGQYRNIGVKMSKFDNSWLGYATSSDGVTWQRYAANPVIELTGEGGCPWMTGVKVDNTYYLYMALRAGRFGIGVITGTITEQVAQEEASAPVFEQASATPVIPHNGDLTDRLNPGATIYHEGQFHMFLNRYDSFPDAVEVGYATSADGLTWTEHDGDPLLTTASVPFASVAVVASDVIVEPDGTWVLYFHTWNTRTLANGRGVIGRATATTPTGPWTVDAEPVLTMAESADAWDGGQVSIADVQQMADGSYRMYYTGATSNGLMRIGLATSEDGRNWVKYDDPTTTAAPFAASDPVVVNGERGDWDANAAYTARVVPTETGWLMLYKNVGTRANGSQMGMATSADGINWTKADAPLFDSAIIAAGKEFALTALVKKDNMLYLFTEHYTDRISETDIFLLTADAP